MKKLLFITLFVPFLAMGQYDFETRYFTITAESLPDLTEVSALDMDFGTSRDFQPKKITDFNKVTAQNYWQAVDMVSALEGQASYNVPSMTMPKLKQQEFGFSVTMLDRNSFDGTRTPRYGVRNTVYQEMRGYYFCGIQPRSLFGN